MVEFKFHCCMPMFVARQWIRHRTACLARGTEVYFDLPGGIQRRGINSTRSRSKISGSGSSQLETDTGRTSRGTPTTRGERVRGMRLRQIDEHTGRVQHTRVMDVFESGVKPVFRMVLADGKEICSTADHKFFFADGWSTVADQTGLREVGGKAVWRAGDYYVHVNGVVREAPPEYRDQAWLNEQYNVLGRTLADIAAECDVTTHTIRKWLRSFGIQDTEEGVGSSPGVSPGTRVSATNLAPESFQTTGLKPIAGQGRDLPPTSGKEEPAVNGTPLVVGRLRWRPRCTVRTAGRANYVANEPRSSTVTTSCLFGRTSSGLGTLRI